MTCKDCNDTRKYQPLIGPPEPCLTCQNTFSKSQRVYLKQLRIDRPPNENAVQEMVKDLIRYGFNSFSAPRVRPSSRDFFDVIDGYITVSALKRLRHRSPQDFARIFPDDQIPVIVIEDTQVREKSNDV